MDRTLIRDLLGEEILTTRPLDEIRALVGRLFLGIYADVKRELDGEDLGRIEAFLGSLLRGDSQTASSDPRQRPLDAYFPGLTTKPWWEPHETLVTKTIADRLEGAFATIRAELLARLDAQGDLLIRNPTAERYPELRGTAWSVCNLVMEGGLTGHAQGLFPETTRIALELEPFLAPGGKVGFICLEPGVRLPLHTDATNAQLTCHLPLVVPDGCGITVGGETRRWQEGRVLFFDHSFEHEAWNEGRSRRLMLLMNAIHPELGEAEMRAWRLFIRKLASSRADGRLEAAGA